MNGPQPGSRRQSLRAIVGSGSPEVRRRARQALDAIDGCVVVGEAEDGASAVLLAETRQPDLVVIDLAMPDLNGVVATPLIRSRLPQATIVVITPGNSPVGAHAALRLGADTTVTRPQLAEGLDAAVNQYHGTRILPGRAVAEPDTTPHPL